MSNLSADSPCRFYARLRKTPVAFFFLLMIAASCAQAQSVPVVTLDPGPVEVEESGTADLILRVSPAVGRDLNVGYRVGADDDPYTENAEDEDYQGSSAGAFFVPAGFDTVRIPLSIINDTEIEATTETLVVTLTPVSDGSYTLGTQTAATVVIKEGVCDRTPQIRDAIRGESDCADVDVEELDAYLAGASFTLDFSSLGITSLQRGEFWGLENLVVLDLEGNSLEALPAGVFAGLGNLEELKLKGNNLSGLTPGVFSDLGALRILDLEGNPIGALSPGVFRGLGSLRDLILWDIKASEQPLEIQAGAFDGLGNLEFLNLEDNHLTTLPATIFSGLGNLGHLRLQRNLFEVLPAGIFSGLRNLYKVSGRIHEDGRIFTLTPEFERVADLSSGLDPGTFTAKLTLREGAPFEIPTTISASGGMASVAAVVLSRGTTQSEVFTVTQPGGSSVEVEMNVAAPPGSVTIGGEVKCDSECFVKLRTAAGSPFISDTVGPSPTGMAFRSTPRSGDAYEPGEIIVVEVSFDEEVVVTGEPVLRLRVGATTRAAVYSPGADSSNKLIFRYRLMNTDLDRDGVSVVSEEIELGGGASITDLAGLAAQRSLAGFGIPDDPGHGVRRRTARFTASRVTLEETSVSTELVVRLSSGFTAASSVGYVIGVDGDPYTADADAEDYQDPGGGVITFAAGATTAAVAIGIDNDDEIEPTSETFTVSLTTLPGGAYVLAGRTTATVVIKEGVCDRTPQVRDALRGESECSEIDDGDLRGFTHLLIEGKEIDALKRGDFLGLGQTVAHLSLNVNNLQVLPTGIFSGFSEVTLLSLVFNRLGALNADTFEDLGKLGTLLLHHNHLSDLPQGLFSDLAGLQLLQLNNNRLTGLEDGVFSGLAGLQELRLESNNGGGSSGISSLSDEVFSELTALETLRLDDNALEELPAGVFSTLGALEELRLDENLLTALPAGVFSPLAALEILRLGGNRLTTLPADLFSGLDNLQAVDLSDNPTLVLPAGLFTGLTGLKTLWLDGADEAFLTLGSRRTDAPDVSSPGVGEFQLFVKQGAPFEMIFDLEVEGGRLLSMQAVISTGSIESGSFTVTQSAGPPVTLRYAAAVPNAGCSRLGNFPCYRGIRFDGDSSFSLDEIPPAITGVEIASSPANGVAYETGESVAVAVRFDEEVTLRTTFGAPAVTLAVGATASTVARTAAYTPAASSTDVLVFSYRLVIADADPDGIGVPPDAFVPGGAQIADLAGNVSPPANLSPAGFGIADDPRHGVRRRTAEFESLGAEAAEDETARLVVRLSSGFAAASSVGYSIGVDRDPYTADADARDYGNLSSGVITFAAGATTAAVEIAIDADGEIEPTSETFTVFLTPLPGGAYVLAAQTTATVVIREGVCDRTEPVRQTIVRRIPGVSECHRVTAEDLRGVPELDLNQYNINALKERDFQGLAGLERLDLNDNALTELPPGIFADLGALLGIDLSGNRLTTLTSGVFADLGELATLNLNNNRLNDLPPGLFSTLGRLEFLFLRGNNLTRLPPGLFSESHGLTRLNLSRNQLNDLPAGAFAGLGSLEELDLSQNSLRETSPAAFSGLGSLLKLYLSQNDLEQLPAELFSGLSSLNLLHLDGNRLSSLPAGVFAGLTGLDSSRIQVGRGLWLQGNPGARLNLFFRATEATPPTSGIAVVRLVVEQGAPFRMVVPLAHAGGILSEGQVTIETGSTQSNSFFAAQNGVANDSPLGAAPLTVEYDLPPVPVDLCGLATCFRGIEFGVMEPFFLDEIHPSVVNAAIASAPANGVAYEPGEIIAVEVSFDEEVVVTGESTLRLRIGAAEPTAVYDPDTADASKMVFRYRVAVTDFDPNGISVVSGEIELGEGGGIADVAGLTANRSLAGFEISDDERHKVNRRRVEFRSTTVEVAEGDTVNLIAVLSSGPSEPFDFGVGVGVDGDPYTDDAEAGDYVVVNGDRSTVAAGATTAVVTIRINDDVDVEPTTESFTVFLTPPISDDYVLGSRTMVTLIIREGVCDRTPRVQRHMIEVINDGSSEVPYHQNNPVNGCADVTSRHLATFTSLDLSPVTLSDILHSLDRSDFLGLTGLTRLGLNGNRLTELPLDILNDLRSLKALFLQGNRLTTLPPGSFLNISNLEVLYLGTNRLSSLPERVFAGLGKLRELQLDTNLLRELPVGTFEGLHRLEEWTLHKNPDLPFELELGFQRVLGPESFQLGPAEIQLVLREGAPFPMDVRLSVERGTLSSDRVSFGTGDTESSSVIVDRDSDFVVAVVNLADPLPQTPDTTCSSGRRCYSAGAVEFVSGRQFVFDNTRPVAVASLEVAPPPGGAWLAGKAGERITVTLGFNEEIIVVPSPDGRYPFLDLEIGDARREAVYDRNPQFSSMTFVYEVEPDDLDRDGISIKPDALRLNGAAIIDVSLDRLVLSLVSALEANPVSNSTYLKVVPVEFTLSFQDEQIRVEEADVVDLVVSVSPAPQSTLVIGYGIGAEGDVGDAEDYADAGRGRVMLAPREVETGIRLLIVNDDDIEPPREPFTVTLNGLVTSALHTVVSPSTLQVVIREGVCDRTAAVRDEIVAEIAGADVCADVTVADLAGVEELVLSALLNQPPVLTTLKTKDFEGLSGLGTLQMHGNQLAELPAGVFSGLVSLENLFLFRNSLRSLPSGIFSDLVNLREMSLRDNQLHTLRPRVFSSLVRLEKLLLSSNDLEHLPADAFVGMDRLIQLYLQDNPGADFELSLGFERTGAQSAVDPDADLRLTLREGAPFDLRVDLQAEGGTLSDSAAELSRGSTTSGSFRLTRTGEEAVLRLTPPGFPPDACGINDCYRGFEIAFNESDAYVLNTLSPAATGVSVVSFPARDGAYATGAGGETIRVEVHFNEAVIVTAPSVTLVLEIGELTRHAAYRPDLSAADKLVFTYAPTFYDFDPDGISIASDALSLNGARVTDRSLSDADLSLSEDPYAILNLPGHKVRRSFFRLFYATTRSEAQEEEIAEVAVGISPRTESAVTAAYTVVPTAASTEDYTDLDRGVVTIPPDSAVGTIRVSITDDREIEAPREFFTLSLVEPGDDAGYVLAAPTTARVVIKEGVCDRSAEVRDEIVARLDRVGDCADVTAADLAGFDGALELSGAGVHALQESDFSGLMRLRRLDLHDNALESLPPGVFAELAALTTLNLSVNRLGELPQDVFLPLAALRDLSLSGNPLGDLPAGIFSSLGDLESLYLNNAGLARLPAGLFSSLAGLRVLELNDNRLAGLPVSALPLSTPLTASVETLSLSNNRIGELSAAALRRLAGLRRLFLDGNRLTGLPAETFVTLANLRALDLLGNPGAPFGLKLRFVRVGDSGAFTSAAAQVRLTLAEGAPFDVPVALMTQGGTTSGQITIAKGSTQTAVFSVARDETSGTPVTVEPVPIVPSTPDYAGVEIVPGPQFVLDDTGPAEVSGVEIISMPREAGVYRAGDAAERITLAVRFNEELIVTPSPGGPTAPLIIGDATRTATYDPAASSTDTLVFHYTPGFDDLDANGIGVAGALAFAGASVVDRSGVAADPSLAPHEVFNAVGHLVERAVFTLTLSPVVVQVEEAATAEVIVHLSPVPVSEVVVRYAVGAPGDSASPDDYTVPGVVTVPGGATTAVIGFFIVEDGEVEPLEESFTVSLVELDGILSVPVSPSVARVVIRTGVCKRTAQVRQAIMEAAGAVACAGVTDADLARVESLSLNGGGLTSLKAEDFDGLVNLRRLDLSGNELERLPAGVLSALARLSALDLSGNRLSGLPAGLFAGSAGLDELHLRDNPPDDPATVTMTLNLRRVDATEDSTATVGFVLAEGAPFDVTPRLTIRGGVLSANQATVPAGATRSASVPVTRDTEDSVLVTPLPPLPPLPRETCSTPPCYSGFAFVAGESLALDGDVWSPRVVGVEIISNPADPPAYASGETIRAAVRFSEEVVATSAVGSTLMLEVGSETRTMVLDRELVTTDTLVFSLRLQAQDFDIDGVSITEEALILGSGDRLEDLSGAEAAVSLAGHAIENASGHQVWPDSALAFEPSLIEVEQGSSVRFTVTTDPPMSRAGQSAVVSLALPDTFTGTAPDVVFSGAAVRTSVRLTAARPASQVAVIASASAPVGSTFALTVGPEILFDGVRFETPPSPIIQVVIPRVSVAFSPADRLEVTAGSAASVTVSLAADELHHPQTAVLKMATLGKGLSVKPSTLSLSSQMTEMEVEVSAHPQALPGSLTVGAVAGVRLREAVRLPVMVVAQDVVLVADPSPVRVEQGRVSTFAVVTRPALKAGQSATVTLTLVRGEGLSFGSGATETEVVLEADVSPVVSVESSPEAAIGSTGAVSFAAELSEGLNLLSASSVVVTVATPRVSVLFDGVAASRSALKVALGGLSTATLSFEEGALRGGQSATLSLSVRGEGLSLHGSPVVLSADKTTAAVVVAASSVAVSTGVIETRALQGVELRSAAALRVEVLQTLSLSFDPRSVVIEQGRGATLRAAVSPAPVADRAATVSLTISRPGFSFSAAGVETATSVFFTAAASSAEVPVWSTAAAGESVSVQVEVAVSSGLAVTGLHSLSLESVTPRVTLIFDPGARLEMMQRSTRTVGLRLVDSQGDYDFSAGRRAVLNVGIVGDGLSVDPQTIELNQSARAATVTVSASARAATEAVLEVTALSGVELQAETVTLPVWVGRVFGLLFDASVVRVTAGATAVVSVSLDMPPAEGEQAVVNLTTGGHGVDVSPPSVTLSDTAPRAEVRIIAAEDAENSSLRATIAPNQIPNATFVPAEVQVSVVQEVTLKFEPAAAEVEPGSGTTFAVTVDPALIGGRYLRLELRSTDAVAVSFEGEATTEVRLTGSGSRVVTVNVSPQAENGLTVEIETTVLEAVGAEIKGGLPRLRVQVTGGGVRLRVRVFIEGALE